MSRHVGKVPPGRLSPAALADARRVLDGAARRLLAAQMNGDALRPASGRNGGGFHDGGDECAAVREQIHEGAGAL